VQLRYIGKDDARWKPQILIPPTSIEQLLFHLLLIDWEKVQRQDRKITAHLMFKFAIAESRCPRHFDQSRVEIFCYCQRTKFKKIRQKVLNKP
jgi:hypothetical protein